MVRLVRLLPKYRTCTHYGYGSEALVLAAALISCLYCVFLEIERQNKIQEIKNQNKKKQRRKHTSFVLDRFYFCTYALRKFSARTLRQKKEIHV